MISVGVLLREDQIDARAAVARIGWRLVDDPFECDKTLIWVPSAPIDLAAFWPVVDWLDTWEMAVPLQSYSTLAQHLGTEEERAASRPLLLDLRQPVYDSRVVWMRDCARTRQLVKVWLRKEMSTGEDADLALLRAVWKIKPLLLALPQTWAVAGGPKPVPKS